MCVQHMRHIWQLKHTHSHVLFPNTCIELPSARSILTSHCRAAAEAPVVVRWAPAGRTPLCFCFPLNWASPAKSARAPLQHTRHNHWLTHLARLYNKWLQYKGLIIFNILPRQNGAQFCNRHVSTLKMCSLCSFMCNNLRSLGDPVI